MRRFFQKIVQALRDGGLPLLSKELTEQSARKRTYVLRVVYATILFLITFLFFFEIFSATSRSPLAVLGQGEKILLTLVVVQFIGIYLFMPAITCSVITQEKERDSLQLLFLTRLGPWTIVFEKLLSRIVPMLGFLLLSLPALAIAYVLGGVTRQMLWSAVFMLVVAVIQTGSIAVMWSAFFRSTVVAFVMSYVLMFVLYFGPYFLFMLMLIVGYLLDISPDQIFRGMAGPGSIGIMYFCVFPCFGLPLYFIQSQLPGFFGTVAITTHAVINLGLSAGFLALAKRFLVSRAFVPARGLLSTSLPRFRSRRVEATPLEFGPETVELQHSDDEHLPKDRPIVWRETEKHWLGNWSGLKRVFLIVELPTIAVCGLLALAEIYARRYSIDDLVEMVSIPMHGMLWLIAILVVSVKSSNLIAGERSHQTLDVLCTTPMTGREILTEKMVGVWRLILVLAVPFLTIFVYKAWRLSVVVYSNRGSPFEKFEPGMYLVCQLLSMAIFLPLVAWVSFYVGLRLRTQARAIIGAMGAVVAWCIAPLILVSLPLAIILDGPGRNPDREVILELSTLLSPATIVFVNEVNLYREWSIPSWLIISLNFTFYGLCLVAVRHLCRSHIDRSLGRLENGERRGDLALAPEGQPEPLADSPEESAAP
ncbi:MAG: ABC transporter permease subunit [Planctomycetes bacterium]|nr:ABC transporter permease subunit [Planctomycetota bacterium]